MSKDNNKKKPTKKNGRPFKITYTEELLKQITILIGFGLTEEEVAIYLDINPETFRKNKKKNIKLVGAIKRGRVSVKTSVTRFLFEKARDGNVTAMIFFLKNRDPEHWSDLWKVEHSGEIDMYKDAFDEVFSLLEKTGSPDQKRMLAEIGKRRKEKDKIEGYTT